MVLQGELAEGVLDRLLVGAAGDAEDLVEVALRSVNGPPASIGGCKLPGYLDSWYSASTTRARGLAPGSASPPGHLVSA